MKDDDNRVGSRYDDQYAELPEWMDMMDKPPELNVYPLQVTSDYDQHGLPIPEYEAEESMRGYEIYHAMPHGSATLQQVASTSCGIRGYAKYARDTVTEFEKHAMEIDDELMITQVNESVITAAEAEGLTDENIADQMGIDNESLAMLLKENTEALQQMKVLQREADRVEEKHKKCKQPETKQKRSYKKRMTNAEKKELAKNECNDCCCIHRRCCKYNAMCQRNMPYGTHGCCTHALACKNAGEMVDYHNSKTLREEELCAEIQRLQIQEKLAEEKEDKRSESESSTQGDTTEEEESSSSTQPSDQDAWEERCAAHELACMRSNSQNGAHSEDNDLTKDGRNTPMSAKRSLSPPTERRNPVRMKTQARKDINTVKVIADNGVTVHMQGPSLTADTVKRLIAGAEDQLDDAFADGNLSDASVRTENTDSTSVINEKQGSEEDTDYEPVAKVQVSLGGLADATPYINETSAENQKDDGGCHCPKAKGKCLAKVKKGELLCDACTKVCINEFGGKVSMMCACDCGPCEQDDDEDESSDERDSPIYKADFRKPNEDYSDDEQKENDTQKQENKTSSHQDTPHPKTGQKSGYTRYEKCKIDIDPDGHCAYATLAVQEFGSKEQWHRVRSQLAEWLTMHWSEVKEYSQHESLEDHLEAITYGIDEKEKGVTITAPAWAWAGEFEISCIAKMWKKEIVVESTEKSKDGMMPQQKYGEEFTKVKRMVPMDMDYWVDRNCYRMLFDRKAQHYSAEAWILTNDNSDHLPWPHGTHWMEDYSVPTSRVNSERAKEGATQILNEVDGSRHYCKGVPPHPSMKLADDEAVKKDGNTLDQTRNRPKEPACAAGPVINQKCVHSSKMFGEGLPTEAGGLQFDGNQYMAPEEMWKEIEEAFCKAEGEHEKDIFKAEEDRFKAEQDKHVKRKIEHVKEKGEQGGYSTPKRMQTEPHTVNTKMNNDVRMCQVYHGAIDSGKQFRNKYKPKAKKRNKLMNRMQQKNSRRLLLSGTTSEEADFRKRSSDTDNEAETLSPKESARRCMDNWNTTTRYHWSVSTARRNTRKGVRKTLRNKIAAGDKDGRYQRALNKEKEKMKLRNEPQIFTAACPPPTGLVLVPAGWHNLRKFRYHTSELCPALNHGGHSEMNLDTMQNMGITECALCQRQKSNPTWKCPTTTELPVMDTEWLQSASLSMMRKQCLSRGVDAAGRQLVVRNRLRIWLKFQGDKVEDTRSTTSESSGIMTTVMAAAAAACVTMTALYRIGPFGASVSYMPPVVAHIAMIMMALLVLFAGFGLIARRWWVRGNDEKKVESKCKTRCGKRPKQKSEPPPPSIYPVKYPAVQKDGPPTGCWKANTEHRVMAGMMVHSENQSYTMVLDSAAELTLVRKSRIKSTWRVIKQNGPQIHGFGGSSTCNQLIEMEIRLRWNAPTIIIHARVADDEQMPRGVDVLLGTKARHGLKVIDDAGNDRVTFPIQQLVVNMEPVVTLSMRQRHRALRIVDMCAGMSASYGAWKDMGWRVDTWLAIEKEKVPRKVAAYQGPEIKHSGENDITKLSYSRMVNELGGPPDVMTGGPPCQSYSSANPSGRATWDHERFNPFKACTNLIRRGLQENPVMVFMMENVVPAPRHKGVIDTWDKLVPRDCAFVKVNAKDLGAPQSRPRMVSTNIAGGARNTRKRPPSDPNIFLDSGRCITKQGVAPCIMARGNETYNPVKIEERYAARSFEKDGTFERFATITELERLQGYSAGVSNAFDCMSVDIKDRHRMVGNAFHENLTHAIFSRWSGTNGPSVYSVNVEEDHTTPLEKILSKMTDEQLSAWMQKKLKGYEPMKLHLRKKEDEQEPYQIPRSDRFRAAQERRPAVWAALKQKMRKKQLKLVEYSKEQYISQMFCKMKGRIDPETMMEACRMLNDLQSVNSIIDWPAWWDQFVPTIEGAKAKLPRWAKWYVALDISNAYESMLIHPDWAHMLTVVPPVPMTAGDYTREELIEFGIPPERVAEMHPKTELFMQWIGCPQGLSAAAAAFNIHMQGFLTQLFNEEYHDWTLTYVDDLCVYAATEEQARQRSRILQAAIKAMGKDLSSKCDLNPSTESVHVGLLFTQGGCRIEDKAIDSMIDAMRENTSTSKRLRRIIGVILYGITAFDWTPGESKTWLAETLDILHKAVNAEPYSNSPQIKQALEALINRVTRQPRALTNPADLVTKETSLVLASDGSDVGTGAALYLCQNPDASKVTEEDLRNPAICQLVATDQRVLSKAERRYLTFEIETWGMVRALKKFSRLLSQALINFPKSGEKKLSLRFDNKTAMSFFLTMDTHSIDHASAKGKRFSGWVDDLAWMRDLPIDMSYCPGEWLTFPDMLSRAEYILKMVAEERRKGSLPKTATLSMATSMKSNRKVGPQVCAVSKHSYHGEAGKKVKAMVPEGMEAVYMKLTTEDCSAMAAALHLDTSRHHGVTISQIYSVALGECGDPVVRSKVEPWLEKRFYLLTPPGSDHKLLFTPSAHQRVRDFEAITKSEDPTKRLVMVVPPKAKVRVTAAEELYDDSTESPSPEWLNVDYRKDSIMLVHDMNSHPKFVPTLMQLRNIAWWPDMQSSCREHLDQCSDCLAERDSVTEVGLGIVSHRRGEVIQVDHYVLPKKHAALAGVPAVLTAVCEATGWTMYEGVKSQEALTSARTIYTRWMPYMGAPVHIVSDSHPGFASEVFTHMCKLMGINGKEMAARAAKGKVAKVERRHGPLSLCLADGFASGKIRSREDFEVYLSTARIKVNHTSQPGRISPHQLMTGQPARSVQEWSRMQETLVMPANIEQDGVDLSEMITEQCKYLLQYELLCRDEKARRNATRRNSVASKSSMKTEYDLRIGDEVSYDGKRYKLEAVTENNEGRPITASLRKHDGTGRPRHARYDQLRPCGVALPTRDIPREPPAEGDLVFYQVRDGAVHTGIVTEVNAEEGKATVREYEANVKLTVWLPRWTTCDQIAIRAVKAPAGAEARHKQIKLSAIQLTGELTATGRLSENTRSAAAAMVLV